MMQDVCEKPVGAYNEVFNQLLADYLRNLYAPHSEDEVRSVEIDNKLTHLYVIGDDGIGRSALFKVAVMCVRSPTYLSLADESEVDGFVLLEAGGPDDNMVYYLKLPWGMVTELCIGERTKLLTLSGDHELTIDEILAHFE